VSCQRLRLSDGAQMGQFWCYISGDSTVAIGDSATICALRLLWRSLLGRGQSGVLQNPGTAVY
jgi:hypothetical protein